jgi:hypothetical protein
MATYPVEFHRRLEQKWESRLEQILSVTATPPPQISSIFIADSVTLHVSREKDKEIAFGRCRMGRYEGRSAGWLRASSQGMGGADPTPRQGKRFRPGRANVLRAWPDRAQPSPP